MQINIKYLLGQSRQKGSLYSCEFADYTGTGSEVVLGLKSTRHSEYILMMLH